MGRESRLRRSVGNAALLVSLSLGTGCLTMLVNSAQDWAALATRYSNAANESGMCPAGAPHAAAAGTAAGLAQDAAKDAAEITGSPIYPADLEVLARVRQLADSAGPAYNAALPAIASAVENSPDNVIDNILWKSLGTVVGESSFVVSDVLSGGATVTLHVFGAVADVAGWIDLIEGPGDEINAARSNLDSALGMIEAAEFELLQMRRRQNPEGTASSAALEQVQALRQRLAQETDLDSNDNTHAILELVRIAEEVARKIVGLQQTVETERKEIATIEGDATAFGTAIHNDEQEAREQAEVARVAAEAALTACGVAVGHWDYDDPLSPEYDQDLSNPDVGGTPGL
jgi:hypothetical protein